MAGRVASAAALALALAAAGPIQAGGYSFAGADPDVLVTPGQYWLYPTGDGASLEAWSSSDLRTWKPLSLLIRKRDIAWMKDGARVHYLWAPHMQYANGKYFLYYAVGPQNPTPSRLGVAICSAPQGPCIDSGKPLLTGGNGFEAIDPEVFVDPQSGKAYLYAGGSAGATLRVFELGPDMETIAREIKVDQPPGFTEAAFMHYRNGLYYLSYSSGRWNTAGYSVRYAISSSPIGPWTYEGVVLHSDATYKGPGHHAFFQDPRDGQWYVVYGRWEHETGAGPYRDERKVAIARVVYSSAGLIEPIDMERGDLPARAAR